MIALMQKNLLASQQKIKNTDIKTAMIFSPNGYTIGKNTIENDVLTLAGYRNLAAEMGIEGFKQISMEKLVIQQPDVVMIDNHVYDDNSLANVLLMHPVLNKISSKETRRFIPSRLRACAGVMSAEAVEFLVNKQ